MKKLLISVLSLMLTTILFAQSQAPEIEWEKTFGGASVDVANSIIQTSDSGYAVCGYTARRGMDKSDFWIIKLSSTGEKQWDKTFGGNEDEKANCIIQTIDGGYAVCGYTYSKGAGKSDFWVIKLSSSGEKQWDKTFGGSGKDRANSIIQTTDGGYAVCGEKRSNIWVIKLSSPGENIWNKSFTSTKTANSIIQTSDGGYAVCGYTNLNFYVIKLNRAGEIQWDKTFGGSGKDRANSIIQTSDGGYAVCGYTKSKGAGHQDFWVIKLSSSGEEIWDKTFGWSYSEEAYSLIQTLDGGYAICGFTKFTLEPDFLVIKLDNSGNKEWKKIIDRSGWDEVKSIIQTSDGGYAICGYTKSKGAGKEDFWVIKLYPEKNKQNEIDNNPVIPNKKNIETDF